MNIGLRTSDAVQAASLARLAEIAYRRRWSILVILLATVISTAVWVFLVRGDFYVAEAKLLVRLGQEQAPLPTMIGDQRAVVASQPTHVNSEIEVLQSRDLISLVVDDVDFTEAPRPVPATLFGRVREGLRTAWQAVRDESSAMMVTLGLKARLTPREQIIEALSHSLVVEALPNSFIIVARMGWSSRGVAAPILDKMLVRYLDYRASLFQGSTAATFFRERRAQAAARVAAAEENLAAFEHANGISNPDEQQSGLEKRLLEASTGVDAARIELLQADMARDLMESSSGDGASTAAAQLGMPAGLAASLATLGARSAGLQTTLSERTTTVRQQKAEVAALSRTVNSQVQAVHRSWMEQLALRERIRDGIHDELSALHDATQRWQELKRDLALASRALDYNDSKLNEAEGIAALETARIGNVIMVQKPTEQATPAGVRKSSLLLLALTAGLAFAAAWVTVREFFDHRIYGPAEAERLLGLPVLATVPRHRLLRRPE